MKISEALKVVPLDVRGRTDWDVKTIANAMAEVKAPIDYSEAYKAVLEKTTDITTAKQAKNGTFAFKSKDGDRIYTITAQGFLRYEDNSDRGGNHDLKRSLSRGRYRTNEMTTDLRANYLHMLKRLADIVHKRDKSKPIAEA